MATRKINPTSPGQRGMTRPDYSEITTSTPEKSLVKSLGNALCRQDCDVFFAADFKRLSGRQNHVILH